jgi:hypothetical protein
MFKCAEYLLAVPIVIIGFCVCVIADLSRAQRTLSNSLVKFNFECIGTSQTDDEVGISVSLKEFGRLIANIEDQRDMMVRELVF